MHAYIHTYIHIKNGTAEDAKTPAEKNASALAPTAVENPPGGTAGQTVNDQSTPPGNNININGGDADGSVDKSNKKWWKVLPLGGGGNKDSGAENGGKELSPMIEVCVCVCMCVYTRFFFGLVCVWWE